MKIIFWVSEAGSDYLEMPRHNICLKKDDNPRRPLREPHDNNLSLSAHPIPKYLPYRTWKPSTETSGFR